jgi:DNA recombination protein RmuC
MDPVALLLAVLLGVLVGTALGFAAARARGARETGALREEAVRLAAEADRERRVAAERAAAQAESERRLRESFEALSAKALRDNNESFLALAEQRFRTLEGAAGHDLERRREAIESLVTPLKEALKGLDENLKAVEKDRVGAYRSLAHEVAQVAEAGRRLERETGNLVTALRRPSVRGRWGEVQLRRVVEAAGMVEHCDFDVQCTSEPGEGPRRRPDLVVRLPGDRSVVVDAKAPLDAYLTALEAPDEASRAAHLQSHVRQVRTHLEALADKAYWKAFDPAPEFVVMFLPGESFFSAALEQDPLLVERGFERGVVLASPTTLVAVLRAVATAWRQERVERNAQQISAVGRELYDRIRVLVGHVNGLRDGLQSSIDNFDRIVGSLERRVLPQANRFVALGASSGEEIEAPRKLEAVPRSFDPRHLPATLPADVETSH